MHALFLYSFFIILIPDQTCVYTWGCEVNAGHKGAELAPRVLEVHIIIIVLLY